MSNIFIIFFTRLKKAIFFYKIKSKDIGCYEDKGFFCLNLGRKDSNLRMPVSKTGALPLGDAPRHYDYFIFFP